jgi:hypothetical protein
MRYAIINHLVQFIDFLDLLTPGVHSWRPPRTSVFTRSHIILQSSETSGAANVYFEIDFIELAPIRLHIGPLRSFLIKMDSKFVMVCGSCFSGIRGNGCVLSCGDFLCSPCCGKIGPIRNCPLCNKEVKSLPLGKDLPVEVTNNVADHSTALEKLYESLEFQAKGYKRLLRKLITERVEMREYVQMLICVPVIDP